ncbi:MAG: hypothetical protein KAS99_05555 [Candidatus Omnitrophica bacterium]|nr:hypothetical protein [Candidatus Omnitrophota bacterium]
MKRLFVGISLVLVLSAYNFEAQAKWWIFGKAEDVPEITSIFIGSLEITNISADELILDKSNLEADDIVIKGFAAKGEAPLAMAKISFDGGGTWVDVNIKGGTFIYRFAIEENEEYRPQFKVIDTAGKESDVRDLPQFTLIYRAVSMQEVVEEVKQAIVDAYVSENLARFMSYVSDSFTGDVFALEEAVQSDFTIYDNMNVDVTIQQVDKSGDRVNADFTYEWSAIETSTGSIVNDSGRSSFIFVQEQGSYKVLTMACPILFGMSEASEISTGFYHSSLPIQTASINDGGSIDFTTGSVDPSGTTGDIQYDSASGLWHVAGSGAGLYELSCFGTLGEYTTVSSESSSYLSAIGAISNGQIYAVMCANGNYAIFKIVSGAGTPPLSIGYKYQPNGSTNLP